MLFEHAERDIDILDLCRRWLASTFPRPCQQPVVRSRRGREAGQSLLDAGGLADLALVHQAVGEGVLPCRPGLCGEIEQHCPGDDAVVVIAEQLLQVLGLRVWPAPSSSQTTRRLVWVCMTGTSAAPRV